jgi:hypothetical protein
MRRCTDYFGIGIACIGYRGERKHGVQEIVVLEYCYGGNP